MIGNGMQQPGSTPRPPSVFNIGAVSFLNARPPIHGLGDEPRVRLTLDVPAELGRRLLAGELHAALVPTIDIARAGWQVIEPGGCIASDDETLTVRVFSRRPIEQLQSLAVDADSHSSVALARIVLGRRLGRKLRLAPMDMRAALAGAPDALPEAALLIGDKVVAAGPNDPASPWPVQLDLGRAWRELTGLPFVFAAWAAPPGAALGQLPELLAASKAAGLADRERIARDCGPILGWPVELARAYLTRHLAFDLTERRRAGMRRFFQIAAEEGLLADISRERPILPVSTPRGLPRRGPN